MGADGKAHLNGKKCVGCHLCVLVCPNGAIGKTRRIGRKTDVKGAVKKMSISLKKLCSDTETKIQFKTPCRERRS
ncbi:MAG: 4Fe-4S binding protein [Clostridiales bacterium]|nr:MAG: 4Fe-4S binding protein [Clostridiales bacterium]